MTKLSPAYFRQGVAATRPATTINAEGLADAAQWFTCLQVAVLLNSSSTTTNNLPWRVEEVARMAAVARGAARLLARRRKSAPVSLAGGASFQDEVGEALRPVRV